MIVTAINNGAGRYTLLPARTDRSTMDYYRSISSAHCCSYWLFCRGVRPDWSAESDWMYVVPVIALWMQIVASQSLPLCRANSIMKANALHSMDAVGAYKFCNSSAHSTNKYENICIICEKSLRNFVTFVEN